MSLMFTSSCALLDALTEQTYLSDPKLVLYILVFVFRRLAAVRSYIRIVCMVSYVMVITTEQTRSDTVAESVCMLGYIQVEAFAVRCPVGLVRQVRFSSAKSSSCTEPF